MSGGSYNYAYHRIQEMADEMHATRPLRRAFKKHLKKVAKACKAVEWVDSGDYALGDEDAAIRECLGEATDKLVLDELRQQAAEIIKELEDIFGRTNE